MELLYIGANANGAFACKKKCQSLGIFYHLFSEMLTPVMLREHTEEVMARTPDVCVFDLAAMEDAEDIITEEIAKIKNSIKTKVIILAAGYPEDSSVLVSLKAMGISLFICKSTLGGIQKELENCLLGDAKHLSWQEQEEITESREHWEQEEASSAPVLSIEKTILKIAVAGSQGRIGTTTAALQFVKFLNTLGENASAYLEYNGTGYVEGMQQLYTADYENGELSWVNMQGMDLFYDFRRSPELLSMGYSYVVYDYGDVRKLADPSSVLDKDLILIVGGVKANEIDHMTDVMRIVYDRNNVFYLFNHVAKADRESILSMQGQKAEKSFFLEYTPDPFVLNMQNGAMFRTILQRDYKRYDKHIGKRRKLPRLFAKRREGIRNG